VYAGDDIIMLSSPFAGMIDCNSMQHKAVSSHLELFDFLSGRNSHLALQYIVSTHNKKVI
jgi:hypothetical protein